MRTARSCLLTLLALALIAVPAMAADTTRCMPNQEARPGGATLHLWGAAGNGGNAGDGSANTEAYAWSYSLNPDVTVFDDGALSGTIGTEVAASGAYIVEDVSFTLNNGSTREQITATLQVGGGATCNVTIDIVDPAEPTFTNLDQQQVDVNIALQSGLRWLYLNQAPDGSWGACYSSRHGECATAGFAIWAFHINGHLPTNDPNADIYQPTVLAGRAYLLGTGVAANTVAANATLAGEAVAAGVSDINSNNQSIRLCSADTFDWGYNHGISAIGVLTSNDPAMQTNVEDYLDFTGQQQCTAGDSRGGWYYNGPRAGNGWGDASIDAWMIRVSEGAEALYPIDAPDWILQEHEYELISHQNNANGPQPGGYRNAGPLRGIPHGHATTCAQLTGLRAVELENSLPLGSIIGAQAAPHNSIGAKRQSALDYLGQNWGVNSNGQLGYGNRNNFYSMATCCMGLRLTEDAGWDGSLTFADGTLFNWETGEINPPSDVIALPGDGREGYWPWLVNNQAADGSWSNGTYVGQCLETPMALLCLSQGVFALPEPECPDDPQPRTQGFWHRQCLGLPGDEGGIDPGRNGRGPQSPTVENFSPDLMDCAEAKFPDLGLYPLTTCEGMDADPPSDKCEKAIKQTTALILNVCWGELEDGCEIDVSAEGCNATDVDSLLNELGVLIDAGDDASCQTAAACADAVNNGYALTNGGGYGQPEQDTPSVRETGDAKGKPGSGR